MFITINRNILTTKEGKYVIRIFLNTKFTKLKNLPGANFYLYMRRVIKIIQKSKFNLFITCCNSKSGFSYNTNRADLNTN